MKKWLRKMLVSIVREAIREELKELGVISEGRNKAVVMQIDTDEANSA